jgi:hypothetical protein
MYYIQGMKNRDLSTRTIVELEKSIRNYLGDWLARPLRDIGRADVTKRHDRIGEQSGESAANHTFRALRAVWNEAMRADDSLPPSPTIALSKRWFKEERKRNSDPRSQVVGIAGSRNPKSHPPKSELVHPAHRIAKRRCSNRPLDRDQFRKWHTSSAQTKGRAIALVYDPDIAGHDGYPSA